MPPEAIKSSTIIIFLFLGTVIFPTSIVSRPYSSSYSLETTGGGHLPFFLSKILGIFNLSEIADPNINPLESIDAI